MYTHTQMYIYAQMAKADFEARRRASLFILTDTPGIKDGFGRNKKRVELLRIEDEARKQQVIICVYVYVCVYI